MVCLELADVQRCTATERSTRRLGCRRRTWLPSRPFWRTQTRLAAPMAAVARTYLLKHFRVFPRHVRWQTPPTPRHTLSFKLAYVHTSTWYRPPVSRDRLTDSPPPTATANLSSSLLAPASVTQAEALTVAPKRPLEHMKLVTLWDAYQKALVRLFCHHCQYFRHLGSGTGGVD